MNSLTRPLSYHDFNRVFKSLTCDQIDAMSHLELEDTVYSLWFNLLPEGTQVFSWHSHQWINPADKQRVFFETPFAIDGRHCYLPKYNTCAGVSVDYQDGQYRASINAYYYPDDLLSFDISPNHALFKVWLKAWTKGWLRDGFWKDPSLYVTPLSQSICESVTFTPLPSDNPFIKTVTDTSPVTHQFKASDDVTLCPCGCGVTLVGRQKSATPACRKRLERMRKAA